MPTLGGNNSFATGINDRGQVSGWAETRYHDPTCIAPQVLRFEAVIWDAKTGKMHELPPFPGDPVAAAAGINRRGDASGTSGVCGPVAPSNARHAVLRRDGKVTDLGSLGGTNCNVGYNVNDLDQVIGTSGLPGNRTYHAFLWQRGNMMDLGTLPGDKNSFALFINDRGQIVGQSCSGSGSATCRAFIWEDGVMTDLNTLIPARSSLRLTFAESINERGAITGNAIDPKTGATTGFLAIPCDCSAQGDERRVILPERFRQQLKQPRGSP